MKGQASHRSGDPTGKYIADEDLESRIYEEFPPLSNKKKDPYPN